MREFWYIISFGQNDIDIDCLAHCRQLMIRDLSYCQGIDTLFQNRSCERPWPKLHCVRLALPARLPLGSRKKPHRFFSRQQEDIRLFRPPAVHLPRKYKVRRLIYLILKKLPLVETLLLRKLHQPQRLGSRLRCGVTLKTITWVHLSPANCKALVDVTSAHIY
jgi:hypothetical protein